MLDFRVKTFLTVCETMNFTRAADRLHVTQPAVSQALATADGAALIEGLRALGAMPGSA